MYVIFCAQECSTRTTCLERILLFGKVLCKRVFAQHFTIGCNTLGKSQSTGVLICEAYASTDNNGSLHNISLAS